MNEAVSQEPRPAGAKRWRRRLLLFVLALIVLVATPPALFWGGGYLFFNTPLGPKLLSGSSGRTSLDWQGGRSWRPGRIEIEGFRLEGKTPRGRWRLEVDRAELRHQLKPLLGRAFIASVVEARGATFSWTSFDEPIELPPRKERSGPGWRLAFPNIKIDGVRRLAFDDNEVDAAARPGSASGAFELVIRDKVTVPRFKLAIDDAVIDRENEALARLKEFRLQGQLEPFNPREQRGVAVLRFATADVVLRSEAWNLSSLSNFFRGLPVRVDGRGALDAQLRVEQGVLSPTSQLDVRNARLRIDYLDYQARGTGSLRLEGDAERQHSTLTATLDAYKFGHLGEPPHVEGELLTLVGSGPPLDLADPEPQFRAAIHVPDARVPDFAVFDEAIPTGVPLRLRAGEGRMDLQLSLDPQALSVAGRVELKGEALEAEIHGEAVSGRLHLQAELDKGEIDTRRFDLGHVSLDLDQVEATGLSDWWARLQIEGGEVTLDRPLRVSGRTAAVLRDATPLAALISDRRRTVAWLHRLLEEKGVRASADLKLRAEDLRLDDIDVASGRRARARGDLLLADDEITGLLLVELGRLAAAAELLPRGERDLKLRGARKWFQSRRDAEAARQGPSDR